jgi:hypothetical protein
LIKKGIPSELGFKMIELFKLVGAAGLLLISIGILTKERRRQDLFYIAGGLCLEAYSIYIGDIIFIILQLVFTFSAGVDYLKTTRNPLKK